MGIFLLLILLFLIVTLVFIGLGLGLGFLLNLLLPQIDLGTGTLIGIVALSAALFAFVQVSRLVQTSTAELEAAEELQDESDVVYMMPDLARLQSARRRRRRR